MKPLSTTWIQFPIIRLLPWLLAGIVTAEYYPVLYHKEKLVFLSLLFLYGILVYAHYTSRRVLFEITLGTFLCIIGAHLVYAQKAELDVTWPENECCYEGTIVGTPGLKEKVVQFQFRLHDYFDEKKQTKSHETIIVSMERTPTSEALQVGEQLILYARIKLPHNNGNPDEFDYAKYLLRQGITGTAYVPANAWKHLSSYKSTHKASLPWLERTKIKAMHLRDKLQQQYRHVPLQGQDLAVLYALTFGDRRSLSSETYDLYSETGASHILALSGLYLGILFTIILSTASFFRRWITLWHFPELLVIILIWLLVFITGFPISLIRSAIMYTLLSLSMIVRRETLSVNNLALSAIILLLINPFSLYDVGFQLSFLSVLAMLLFHPLFHNLISPKNQILNYFVTICTVSICAQAGVAPLIAYYFHSFPTWFLLTNILVIPISFILLCLWLLFFATSICGVIQAGIGFLIAQLILIMHTGLKWIADLPLASIHLSPTTLSVCVVYVVLATIYLFVIHKKQSYLIASICGLIVMEGLEWIDDRMHPFRPQIVFYNISPVSVVHFIASQDQHYIWSSDSAATESRLKSVTKNFWKNNNMKAPIRLDQQAQNHNILFKHGIAWFCGKRILLLHDNYWLMHHPAKPLKIDYAYICNKFHGQLGHILEHFDIHHFILDRNLRPKQLQDYTHICDSLHIKYHDMAVSGAAIIPL